MPPTKKSKLTFAQHIFYKCFYDRVMVTVSHSTVYLDNMHFIWASLFASNFDFWGVEEGRPNQTTSCLQYNGHGTYDGK